MTRVNLLPWREIRRRELDRRVLFIGIGAWLLMGLAVLQGHLYMTSKIEHQNNRNGYLKQEIAKVEESIKEINAIRKRKADLIARMDVIQQLQRDRTQIVHVFDDLVRKLPKGVYLTGLRKQGKGMTLTGFAQSNARISSLMRNLDSSEWFANPNLDVINVSRKDGSPVSKFTLRVTQEIKRSPEEEDDQQKVAGAA
ncbi:MAG: PilN domain-containing protein [Gammaproteobacteria bacterium]|nr:PilN domain-containing protein [Gammaproteobacteria bacterium]